MNTTPLKSKTTTTRNGLTAGLLALLLLLAACGSEPAAWVPKPRGYPRLNLPEHAYQQLDTALPYTFRYSAHAQVMPDTSFMTEPHWVEVVYPGWGAQISISYKYVRGNRDSLAAFFNISGQLTDKHTTKAEYIDSYVLTTEKGYTAVISHLEGETPSYFQWFVTDSTDNFLRAALYFDTATAQDSLQPVISYIKEEMMAMLQSVEWKQID